MWEEIRAKPEDGPATGYSVFHLEIDRLISKSKILGI